MAFLGAIKRINTGISVLLALATLFGGDVDNAQTILNCL